MAEQRYEREINELLQRLAKESREPLPFRRRRTPAWVGAARRLRQVVAVQSLVERLMAFAVVLLLATLVFGVFAPALARPSGLLAVGCFVAALAVSVWSGTQGGNTRRYHVERTSYPHGTAVDWSRLVWRVRRWFGRYRQ
jgi:hypothetical protein